MDFQDPGGGFKEREGEKFRGVRTPDGSMVDTMNYSLHSIPIHYKLNKASHPTNHHTLFQVDKVPRVSKVPWVQKVLREVLVKPEFREIEARPDLKETPVHPVWLESKDTE